MKGIFLIGIVIGIVSRMITLKNDRKQYPTQPNMLVSQIVLAVIGSALGAMLVPALIKKSYTSITFLSLAASQFRQ
ncbi:MAG: YIEGIA domain-containing protein, partial [Paeniclostridium sordellii]|nr:YIEGIA domain-containing protein [Paeniclostridium sordellii]